MPADTLFPYWCWVIFLEGGARGLVVAIVFSFLNHKTLSQGLLTCMSLVPGFWFLFFSVIWVGIQFSGAQNSPKQSAGKGNGRSVLSPLWALLCLVLSLVALYTRGLLFESFLPRGCSSAAISL